MVSTFGRVSLIRSANIKDLKDLYFSTMSQIEVLDKFQNLFLFGNEKILEQTQVATYFSQYYRFKIKKKFQSISSFREAKQSAALDLQTKLTKTRLLFLVIIIRSSFLLLFTQDTFSGIIL